MSLFIYIFIISLVKCVADCIKVPAVFDSTFFSKFKGNRWIDPEVSSMNHRKLPKILYPVLVHFSDLWHLCNSIMISSFIMMALTFDTNIFTVNKIVLFFLLFVVYGLLFEWFLLVFKITKK